LVLDGDEALLAQGPTPKVDARILRLQAAPPEGLAVEVARYLLGTKLAAQAQLLKARFGLELPHGGPGRSVPAWEVVEELAGAIDGAETVEEARQLEASAANLYFSAWAGHPATTLRFARGDASRVPAHWPIFTGRSSPVTKGNYNRKAATPLNACLNYLYKVAAVEARLALLRIGLHPSLGFVHYDEAKRENLVWDLLETVRLHGFLTNLFTPYAGYLHLAPRTLAQIDAQFPVQAAAWLFAVEGSAAATCCALVVFAASREWLHSRAVRAAMAASMLLLPVSSYELLANITNPGLLAWSAKTSET
jgi:hypothetical protein